jgi:Phosphatidylinositol-4-phosphate 5-Kinase
MHKSKEKFLRFNHKDQTKLNKIIEKDTQLLKRHNIMDYSLLFAVEANVMSERNQRLISKSIY